MRKKISMPTVSLLTAQLLFNVSSVALIVGALAVFAGTIGTVWMGSVKERYGDERIAANEAVTAGANEAAGKANERAAELALELEKERIARTIIEERVRNQGEQVKGLMPRRLLAKQREQLVRLLSISPSAVSVAQDMAAADAKLLSNEIAESFQVAGWKVITPQVMGIGDPPPTGFAFRVANNASLTAVEKQVKDALEESGIPFDLQLGRRPAPQGLVPGSGFGGRPVEMFPEVEIILTTRLR